ncbi:ferredoxin [Novosphingobium aquimarinum]|uniref:ferredoxin n=1 Tax=Novosphingobium aquimarinum TaxID=2682494 RepID=UPI0012EC92A5|nr:ferredoxin [Novosphingobium aquimarinum]
MLTIKVDTALCSGHARCAAVAPDIYILDDDGYCIADGIKVPEEHETLAKRGARACPERAITIVEE